MTTKKVVALTPGKNEGIPADLLDRLLDKGTAYGLEEIIPVRVKDIRVANWVQLKCRYGCQRFNQSWCCPPATPAPDQVRAILDEYAQALLLVSTQKEQSEDHRDSSKKRIKQIQYWKGAVALERMLFLAGYYKSFSLVGVCCALCKKCAYPEQCKFPQEKRPSVESFSIDVLGTLKGLNRMPEIFQDKADPVRFYSIILIE